MTTAVTLRQEKH